MGRFLKTPKGVGISIYFSLVVFWGAAMVFFMLGFIPLRDDKEKKLWVEIAA